MRYLSHAWYDKKGFELFRSVWQVICHSKRSDSAGLLGVAQAKKSLFELRVSLLFAKTQYDKKGLEILRFLRKLSMTM
ncbi:hypothetical protein [Campylobacter troglodytis]|uniref:hypothetical protein n=1 Tax=Campylobacter troglodytis TaxID=654363 RepID=UPI001159BBF1|nr:hypothetical protein [Campylobacter troglodytis]TQR60379.1 hypothetical protein DMC01_06135 [Campylobacter troglodytis]